MYKDGDINTVSAVCFTGHRSIGREYAYRIPTALKRVVEGLIERGAKRVRAGGAVGFDMIAALCILELKQKHSQISLELVLPCKTQTRGWEEASVNVYNYILRHADKVEYVSDEFTSRCMHERNRMLVDESQVCVAFCAHSGGGSAYTFGYALKKGLEVINIYDIIKNIT